MTTRESKEGLFDFDQWNALAKSNPEAFEARRQAIIEETIAGAPKHMQQRLRGLQWRIDMERSRAKNPTAACVNIYRMMWNRVYGENGLLEALDSLMHFNGEEAQQLIDSHKKRTANNASVVQFKVN